MSEFKKLDRIPSSDAEIRILIAPLVESVIEYNDIIMENTQESIQAGMERTKAELKKQGLGKGFESDMGFFLNGSLKAFPIADIDFEEFSQEVSDRMKHDTFIASQGTIDRMSGDVMHNIKDSYEQGYGIDKAAVNLQDVFDDMEDWELKRVARTEINGAQNLGAEATMRQLGIQYDMWRTAGDARVRGNKPEDSADHKYLNGQITTVGGRFSNGLTRPGDRSGRIAEWIQCRCVLLPYLMPEGYAAPSMSFFYVSDLVKVEIPKPGVRPEPGAKPIPKPRPKPKPKPKPKDIDIRTGRDLREDLKTMQLRTKSEIRMGEVKINEFNKELDRLLVIKPDPGINYDNPAYLKWQKKYSEALNLRFKERVNIGKLEREINNEFAKLLQVNKDGFKMNTTTSLEFDMKGYKNSQRGLKEFSKMIDEDMWVDDAGFKIERIRRGRASFDNDISIHIKNYDSKGVIIHETGHYMEKHSPGVHKKVMDFYDKRTKGCPLEWLGPGYEKHEMTRKDKFMSAYMGKDYKGEASEILSMGLEQMYWNPTKFATEDPEMFDFIFNLVRGII